MLNIVDEREGTTCMIEACVPRDSENSKKVVTGEIPILVDPRNFIRVEPTDNDTRISADILSNNSSGITVNCGIIHTSSKAKSQERVEVNREIIVRRSVTILRRWIGEIETVETKDRLFMARLSDLSGDEDDICADFRFSEIRPNDIQLIAPGALFYWVIGFEETDAGVREVSEIQFRAKVVVSEDELLYAKERARMWKAVFDNGISTTT